MMSRTEVERLAAAGNALRPDWPIRSLVTILRRHEHRAYLDVAVALAWVATDPQTETPGRLDELGPWWAATTRLTDPSRDAIPRRAEARCPQPGHEHERAARCRICAADAKAIDDREAAARAALTRHGVPPDRIRQIRAGEHTPPSPQDRAAGDHR